jgi:endonuclease/exonuclease/phosphatase family metal-dependent hydrolase
MRAAKGVVEFDVLAIWTHPHTSGNHRSKYVSALISMFERYQSVLRQGRTIILGDINADGTLDPAELPTALKLANEIYGVHSAYHAVTGEAIGAEEAKTYQHGNGNTFHLDYVLLPQSWTIHSIQVESMSDWITTNLPARSDHAPVIVDFEVPA